MSSILIVDDQRLFAEAIRNALERAGMTVVGVASDACTAVEAARQHQPDVVLMDLGLPDRSGIVVGKEILDDRPETTLIVVTAIEDREILRECIRVGFHGYITKDSSVEDFVGAIKSVLDGNAAMPAADGRRLVERTGDHSLGRHLTQRERAVLQMLVEGMRSPEIARRLGVSPNTVRTHVNGILSKLQVHSRLEAAAYAVQHRLVDVRT